MKLSLLTLSLFGLLFYEPAIAQGPLDSGLWLGVGGGYGLEYHQIASPGVLPVDLTNCAQFTGGHGGVPVAIVSADWRFAGEYGILVRAAYTGSTVNMNSSISALTKDASGSVVPLLLDQKLVVPGNALGVDILPELRLGMLRTFAGVAVDYLSGMKWSVVSSISSPQNVTFLNGQRSVDLLPQSAIPNVASLLYGISGGVGLDLPLSTKLSLCPELSATYFLNSLRSDISWKKISLTLVASVRYSLGCNSPGRHLYRSQIDTIAVARANPMGWDFLSGIPRTSFELADGKCEPDTIETARRTDTIFKQCEPLIAKVLIYGSDEDGKLSNAPLQQIHIEMEYVLDKIPLLPCVFFGAGSATIPERYLNTVSEDPDSLASTSVQLNHNLLSIVGQRLRDKRSAKILVRGYVDSTELMLYPKLAQSRAKAIGEYFVAKWNIEKSRIQIDSSAERTPITPTSSELAAGRDENRRVELFSNSPSILAPEDRDSILEPGVINPSTILIRANGSSSGNLLRVHSELKWQSRVEYDTVQSALPPARRIQITPAVAQAARNSDQIETALILSDSCNHSADALASILVAKDTSKFSVRRFTLVNFRIGSAELSSQDTLKLHQFFAGILPADKIAVKGYTDYLGNNEENMHLSKQRADAIATYWQRNWRTGSIVSNTGVGDHEFVFGISNYDTPEERFLSRTVVIEIRHPK